MDITKFAILKKLAGGGGGGGEKVGENGEIIRGKTCVQISLTI